MEKLSRATIKASLHSTFSKLTDLLNAPPATAKKWAEDLISQYTEPQRHYHTINHIHTMISSLKENEKNIKNHVIVELAIYFHDWVYDPQAKDNEIQSINCFRTFAEEVNLDPSTTAKTASYIERTITHTLPPPSNGAEPDSDLCFLLDFDLEVLSRAESDYHHYARQIRQEYGHFSNAEYCAGRIEVLRSFLGRERLYFLRGFYQKGEERARENLGIEIVSLEAALVGFSRGGHSYLS